MRGRDIFLCFLIGGLLSCEGSHTDVYTCNNPCLTCEEPCPSCKGECVSVSALGWKGPLLLWQGSSEQAEGCPKHAPRLVYEGHDVLSVVNPCATCQCGSPLCVLPAGVIVSDGSTCNGPIVTPFYRPDVWDGTCTSRAPISSLGSLSYLPVTVTGCEPMTSPMPSDTLFAWQKLARACQVNEPASACDDPTKSCVPTSEPPLLGFSQCIFKEGEHAESECPNAYPVRHVYYEDFEDRTSCSLCTCGDPMESRCVAFVDLFEDADCSHGLNGLLISTSAPFCRPLAAPESELAGMRSWFESKEAGTCAPSGGQVIGEPTPTNPSTFCCIE